MGFSPGRSKVDAIPDGVAMLNWLLATRRKAKALKALHAWRQGYMVGLSHELFDDMPDLVLGSSEVTLRINRDLDFAQGYAWARNNPVAVSLPDDVRASAQAGEG